MPIAVDPNNSFPVLTPEAFDTSTTESSLSLTMPSTKPACRCMQTALGVLENLEVSKTTTDDKLYKFDHTLSFQKRAVTECHSTLKCKDCSASSAFIMLLIIISEKMVLSFERLFRRLRQQYSQQHAPLSSPTFVSEPDESLILDGGPRITVGVYEVDSVEERISVIRLVALLRLRNLEQFLTRLISIANTWNWMSHITNLQTIARRSRDIASAVRVINS